jgi:small subunit ribosomal protein S3
MIERKFVAERLKEYQIQEFISETLRNVGHSHTKLVRTPLGEKIIIFASRPGLVVGKSGENIKKLTAAIKKKFELENPQIEISEVENPSLDAQIVAERIASTMERFGVQKFKAIAHKMMEEVMNAGALGIEIRISGKVPSARAKSWRFYSGYLKKCGDIAVSGVKRAYSTAKLKPGVVGIKVRIMPSDVRLPDRIAKMNEIEVAAAQPSEQTAEAGAEATTEGAKKESKQSDEQGAKQEKKPRRARKDKQPMTAAEESKSTNSTGDSNEVQAA